MVFPVTGGTQSTGYEVSNSLRFNDGDSARLTLDPGTSTNNKKCTLSFWAKIGVPTSNGTDYIFSNHSDGNNRVRVHISNTGEFAIFGKSSGSTFIDLYTNARYRDPSAWYHFLVRVDSTDGTANNRLKLYVNGTLQTDVTQGTNPDQNADVILGSQDNMTIGAGHSGSAANSNPYDGYLAEMHFLDGTAYDASYFGEFDDNNVWIPKKYTGGNYGTNGFYMEFKQTGTSQNASGIGADTSGQDNHFAVTNLAATDITEDTCTNNFATLNPLFRSNFDNDGSYSEGNVQRSFTSANSDRGYGFSTFGVTSGKWYWEVLVSTVARANTGIGDINAVAGFSGVIYDQNPSKGFIVNYNGQIEENATATSYASSLSDGDTVMWALDMDNHRAYYGINGTWQDSGDPASGSTGTGDVTTQISDQSHLNTGEAMFPFCLDASTSGTSNFKWNFGNPFHTISSGNNDGKYGNFEYAVPSGYYALCTKRLAEFG